MKVVLDTNVVMSGVFFSGAPHRLLRAWNDGLFGLVVTPGILAEYDRVSKELAAKFAGPEVGSILQLLALRADMIEDIELDAPVTRDRDDDRFLLCAALSGAVLVSGDKDLLAADGMLGVEVVSPRTMLNRLRRS